ncbi:zf-TFIIB domain-containing protein [Rhizobium sp. KVB221]|uniref:Zf-TFIIB domain-containing protein n=1 Tax=Rhizobium setariae TaxID=2801340 RepID=A0A936YTN9_9HYPH|nr:zf-TFIIB domain-containing protein [Rhizobium setariae]MBL0372597.1 zf-TFIIB domain-containing protein [Rhizobium setariae]
MNSPHAGLVCPSCRVSLVMSERQGVEIDYCPQCRGVWLDRGELDKIIERNGKEMATYQQPVPQPQQPQQPQYQQNHNSGYGQPYPHGYQKRKKSFFEELFD